MLTKLKFVVISLALCSCIFTEKEKNGGEVELSHKNNEGLAAMKLQVKTQNNIFTKSRNKSGIWDQRKTCCQ